MCKPNFIPTRHPEKLEDLNFDINVMSIDSHQIHDSHLSLITVAGLQHYVFTSELKEFVNLPRYDG
mgnify:CR=1 FL=1|jgi:hypothetical protein